MTLFAVAQAVLLALIGGWCLWRFASRFTPRTVARLRLAFASRIDAPAGPHWRRALARRLAPAPQEPSGSCGSGGCSACAGCAIKTQLAETNTRR